MEIGREQTNERFAAWRSPAEEPRSLGTLFHELSDETSALLRAEAALIRSEMDEKLRDAKRGAASVVAGGAVALVGVLTLAACAVLVLALWLAAWVAALVVGAALTLIGFALVKGGRKQITAENLVPHRTIETVKDASYHAKEYRQ